MPTLEPSHSAILLPRSDANIILRWCTRKESERWGRIIIRSLSNDYQLYERKYHWLPSISPNLSDLWTGYTDVSNVWTEETDVSADAELESTTTTVSNR